VKQKEVKLALVVLRNWLKKFSGEHKPTAANTLSPPHKPQTLCPTQRFRSQNSQQHGKKCVFDVSDFLEFSTMLSFCYF
jgi:hypothetical protein